MWSLFCELPPELLKQEAKTCVRTHYDENEYKKLHTKQLLKELDGLRKSNPANCCFCCSNWRKCDKINEENMNMIRKILATREHVLNKKESKQLRKERIKRGV